jgi:hypothetical protein
VIVDLETCNFRFIDNYLTIFFCIFSLVVSKSTSCRQSAREYSQRTYNHVIRTIWNLSNSCSLINLSTSFNNSLLLVRIWRFVIFANLIALIELLANENCSGVSKISCVADIIMNKNNKSTTSTIISFLFPLVICFNKGFSQGCRHVFSPIRVKEVLMKFLLKELRTLCASVSVINTKPFSIFFKINSDFVIIRLSI